MKALVGRCHVEQVMGMAISIDVRDPALSSNQLDSAIATCVAWLHRVDEVFSTYKADSEISRLGRGELALSDCCQDVREVLRRCDDLRRETDGYFNARASDNRTLDPSGLVKGWAVQRASELLTAAGSAHHCINAAGDIAVVGGAEPGRPWRVGISHPLERDALCAVVDISDGAVATSGVAERGLHVYDPHSGRPAVDLASVTIVGADLGTTDAYATAALAMGLAAPAWLERLDGYSAYVVDATGHAWWTSSWPG